VIKVKKDNSLISEQKEKCIICKKEAVKRRYDDPEGSYSVTGRYCSNCGFRGVVLDEYISESDAAKIQKPVTKRLSGKDIHTHWVEASIYAKVEIPDVGMMGPARPKTMAVHYIEDFMRILEAVGEWDLDEDQKKAVKEKLRLLKEFKEGRPFDLRVHDPLGKGRISRHMDKEKDNPYEYNDGYG
jgi:C4-type Zn-finger protein